MVQTIERPAETQINPHFNPEISMDQLARSIFDASNSFDIRHASYTTADSVIILQELAEGTGRNEPSNATLLYSTRSASKPPTPLQRVLFPDERLADQHVSYTWQLSTPGKLIELRVDDKNKLSGWLATFDQARRVTGVVDLEKAEILEAWRSISKMLQSPALQTQMQEFRSQRMNQEIVLARFLASHEISVCVPEDFVTRKDKITNTYMDENTNRLMANMKVVVEGKKLEEEKKRIKERVKKIGFAAMSLHPKPIKS